MGTAGLPGDSGPGEGNPEESGPESSANESPETGSEESGTPEGEGESGGGELILGKYKSQDDLVEAHRQLTSETSRVTTRAVTAEKDAERTRELLAVVQSAIGGKKDPGETQEQYRQRTETFVRDFTDDPIGTIGKIVKDMPNEEVSALRKEVGDYRLKDEIADAVALLPAEFQEDEFRNAVLQKYHSDRSNRTKRGRLEEIAFETLGRFSRKRETALKKEGRKEALDNLEQQETGSLLTGDGGKGGGKTKKMTPEDKIFEDIKNAEGSAFHNFNL